MSKKNFENNPAMQFISNHSSQNRHREETRNMQVQEPKYKQKPVYVETKSKRINLLIQPSLYDAIKDKASKQGISVNEYIHVALVNAVEQ